jgi:hypothetical protein
LNKRVEEYMDIVDHPEKAHQKKVFSGYKLLDELLG